MVILIIETVEVLRSNFLTWKEAFESMSLTVNFGKSKVMVGISIIKNGMSKSKVVWSAT